MIAETKKCESFLLSRLVNPYIT